MTPRTPEKMPQLWFQNSPKLSCVILLSATLFFILIKKFGMFKLHPFQHGWLWKPLKRETMLHHSNLKFDLFQNDFLEEEKKKGAAAQEDSTEESFACKHLQVNGETLSPSLLISLMLHQMHTPISVEKRNKSQCCQVDLGNIFFRKQCPNFYWNWKFSWKYKLVLFPNHLLYYLSHNQSVTERKYLENTN